MAQRVLYLNHVSCLSGAEKSLLDLLSFLNQELFQPLVACPSPGPLITELEQKGIPVAFIKIARLKRTTNFLLLSLYLEQFLIITLQLIWFLKKEKVSLVHANSTTAFIYASVAAYLTNTPAIWHVRDIVPLGFIGRILADFSSRIICISQAVAGELIKCGISEKRIVVINNGIDFNQFQEGMSGQSIRSTLSIDNNTTLIATIGQLVLWKRQQDFIQAAAIISSHYPRTKFLIIGEDLFTEHHLYVRQLKTFTHELGLEDKIVFIGYRSDIPQVLAAVDIFVLPSEGEPFGRVIIEAMAMAKPVVATNLAGPTEIIENNVTGILVSPRNPEALAAAVSSLIEHPDVARKMGLAGRKRVQTYFDGRDKVKEVEKIYAELCGER